MEKDWKTATDDEILDADLMIELGLSELPEEQQAKALLNMSNQVEEVVMIKALSELNEEQRKSLDIIIEANDASGIKEFMAKEVSNYPDIYQAELIKYKRVMLTGESPQPRQQ